MTASPGAAAEATGRGGGRRIALAAAGVTLAALALLVRGPGVSRDEAEAMAAAGRQAGVLLSAPAHPLRAAADADAAFGGPRPHPPLAETALGLVHASLAKAGLDLVAWRLGAVLFAAALSFVLALLGHDLGGAGLAVLAPLAFWLAPRHLHQGLLATPDLAEAAAWIATFLAWRRALLAASRRLQLRWIAAAAIAFGAAAAIRSDGWAILPLLAVHAGAVRLRTRRAIPALPAMAVVGPLVVLAAWPWLLRAPLARAPAAFFPLAAPAAWPFLGEVVRNGPLGPLYPLAVTALTLPAALLAAAAGGLVHAVVRLGGALRGGEASLEDELLLLLGALGPLGLAAAGLAPFAPGLRPWLPAMPFLALLAGRALLAAARTTWPARARPLAGALALLTLYPALRATIHHFPHGASAWNEIAGGAPGAASLGLARQDGGEAAAAVLAALAAHAPRGARVFWGAVAPGAVELYRREGRLRADLADAAGPEEADLAVVAVEGRPRELEARVWTAFRTARPVAGAYLDEVPLAHVYARPGAWR